MTIEMFSCSNQIKMIKLSLLVVTAISQTAIPNFRLQDLSQCAYELTDGLCDQVYLTHTLPFIQLMMESSSDIQTSQLLTGFYSQKGQASENSQNCLDNYFKCEKATLDPQVVQDLQTALDAFRRPIIQNFFLAVDEKIILLFAQLEQYFNNPSGPSMAKLLSRFNDLNDPSKASKWPEFKIALEKELGRYNIAMPNFNDNLDFSNLGTFLTLRSAY